MASNTHYENRIELLKELIEFWKNGQMVGLTEISLSMHANNSGTVHLCVTIKQCILLRK